MYSESEEISESLVRYIMDQTGLSRRDIVAVLKAERKYYLENLLSINEDIQT